MHIIGLTIEEGVCNTVITFKVWGTCLYTRGRGGILLGIFGWGVPPTSPNPDPISDQKMPFPTPVFRPGLKNPYPFSDLTLYVIKHRICISAEQKST